MKLEPCINRRRARRALFALTILGVLGTLSPLGGNELSPQTIEWKLRVTEDRADIRLKPDLESPVAATVIKGALLTATAVEGSWFRITLPGDKGGAAIAGYISSNMVEILGEKAFEPVAKLYRGLNISLGVFGGLALLSGGDFDSGTRGLYEQGAAILLARGFLPGEEIVSPHKSGFAIGMDLSTELNSRWRILAGVTSIAVHGKDNFEFVDLNGSWGLMESLPDTSALIFKLGLSTSFPIFPNSKLRLGAGPALFVTSFDYVRNAVGGGFSEEAHLHASAARIGLQGEIGLDATINDRTEFFVAAQGRFAGISNIKGRELYKLALFDWAVPDIERSGTLFVTAGTAAPVLAVYPDGEAPPGARKAIMDFSGVDLVAGLRIRF